jgi:transcriptional regulator with XRE-family HTH domain
MNKDYGPALRKSRLNAGLSQAKVAEKVGVTQVTISNWELGNTAPGGRERKQLAAVLGALNGSTSEERPDGAGLFGEWLRTARHAADLTVPELATASGVSAVQIYNLEAGRSTNPRAETRERLEAALKTEVPQEVQQEVVQEREIKGLSSLTDFDPYNREDRPECAGVYVFYDVSDRPVYVGKARVIRDRVKDHEQKFWFKPPIVTHAAFIEIVDDRLRHQIEQVLIKFLKSNAVINTQSVDRD